jgi:molybdopterin molybdotransferase
MISFAEARDIINNRVCLLAPRQVSLLEASGLVLAEDVHAQASVPNFAQSAMDGYAITFSDYLQKRPLTIAGKIAAGDDEQLQVARGQAVRIFTGAPVPATTDTVVMQEKTSIEDGKLIIHDEQLQSGSNVRLKGTDIQQGALALTKGTVLSAGAIGFLSSAGIATVKVFPRPRVHIIVTGKELQQPGLPLKHAQVYESNAVMLQSALKQMTIEDATVSRAGDDAQEIEILIDNALSGADLVLVTGGVSVGEYDFVVQAAEAAGVKRLFHKVKQKPGKPIYTGTKDNKLLFGLPGNPASVLTCFYIYVAPAIERMIGKKNTDTRRLLPLDGPFHKKNSLTWFLKSVCENGKARPLDAQESFRLSSFAHADSLIILPEEKTYFEDGDMVETVMLP